MSIPIDKLQPAAAITGAERFVAQQGPFGQGATLRGILSQLQNWLFGSGSIASLAALETQQLFTTTGTFPVGTTIVAWQPASSGSVTFILPPNPAPSQRHAFFYALASNAFPMTIQVSPGQLILSTGGSLNEPAACNTH